MSALGSLVVKLSLEYAEYTQGLDKSSQAALMHAKNVQRNFDSAEKSAKQYFSRIATGAVAAVAAYAGINAAIDRLSNSINTLAKLDDMAQKTGSSVENLSRIQKTVAAFGGDFGAVDNAIAKPRYSSASAVASARSVCLYSRVHGIERFPFQTPC